MSGLRIAVAVLIIFIFAFVGCAQEEPPVTVEIEEIEPQTEEELAAETPENAEAAASLDEIPVSRAQVAKMLALTFLTPDEIENMKETIAFSDVKKTDWHYKYINAAFNLKHMLGGRGEFRPETPLSIYEAQMLIDRINPQNTTQVKITPETRDLPISYALWQQLYTNALTELAGDKTPEQKFGLANEELIVLATPANAGSLPVWSMVADKGAFYARGLNLDTYIGKKITVYAKQKEVAIISKADDSAPVIESAYVRDAGNGRINVYSGGVQRTYRLNGASGEIPEIADVKIMGETAEIISFPTDTKTGEVKRVTEKYIELADGKINAEKDIKVYLLNGGVPVYKAENGLIPGVSADFYLRGGKICSAVVREKPKPENMRVLISSTDYKMAVHTEVAVSSTSDFSVSTDEGEKKFKAGETLVFDKDNNSGLFSSERIYITPDDSSAFIELKSVLRSGKPPKYRGALEVSKEGEAFVVVNTLSFEEYLYSVVSSQIPDSLGETAAAAQAVASRSNAYNQFYESRFAYYGANVDDTVKSQLYNASPETEISVSAVNETKGRVLAYEGEVIKPAGFLVSAGHTANRGEAFQKSGGTRFPSATPPYLKAAPMLENNVYGDLSQEENAARFFKESDESAYEKDAPWFRWSFKMEKAELEAAINANIKEKYAASPSQVLTLSDGVYISKPIDSIGEFINMEVVKRGEGGNVMELRIIGTNGEYLVKTESGVRTVLRPFQYVADKPPVVLTRADGSTLENYYILPSSFFVFEIERGENFEITSVSFYGGGCGHGVGMSQYAAKALADLGETYDTILLRFFGGCELADIAEFSL